MQYGIPHRHPRPTLRFLPLRRVAALCALLLAVSLVPPAWAAWPNGTLPVALNDDFQILTGLVPDGKGGLFVMWTDAAPGSTQYGVFVQHFNNGGARTWGDRGVMAVPHPAGGIEPLSRMVSDGHNGVIVAAIYSNSQTRVNHLVVQRLGISGNALWASGGVDLGDAYVAYPILVSDDAGGAIVGFTTPTLPSRFVAQHLGDDGTPLWPSPGITPEPGGLPPQPFAVRDGAGGAIFAWTQSGTTATHVAQRVSGGGVSLWSAAGIALPDDPQAIAEADGNGFVLAWYHALNQDMYMQKYDGSGSPVWAPGGVLVSHQMGVKSALELEPDGAGGVYASWALRVFPDPNVSILAQHLDASGTAFWALYGVVAASAQQITDQHAMTSDGVGGLYVTFGSADPNSLVYLQRLAADGSRAGPVEIPVLGYYGLGASDARGNTFFGWATGDNKALVERRTTGRGQGLLKATAEQPVLAPLAAIKPNPARGAFRAAGSLPTDAPAEVQLYDLRGRMVASRQVVPVAGAWSISFGESEHLASGTYVLRVIQGNQISTGKVSLIH
jgi:hypothetical protein